MKGRWQLLNLCVLTGIVAAGASAQAATPVSNGRVSVVEGNLLVKGPDDTEWSYLDRNGVVFDGDMVWADLDSVAELEMERGAWLRLGPDTRALLRRLPPGGDVEVTRGSLYVDLSERTREGVLVRTPSGNVEVEAGAMARVDAGGTEEARVLVRRGEVVARPKNGASRRVDAGGIFYLEPRLTALRLASYQRDDWDAFDTWSDERVSYYAQRPLPRYLPEYLPGAYELDQYGDWVQYEGANYWRPRSVDADWRPYNRGYWGYGRDQLVWMPQDPWGYTTSHYGNWTWVDNGGWLWSPGTQWSPARVSWARSGDNLLWAPLDPSGRAVYRGNPFSVGNLLIDPLTWSMMPQSNFLGRNLGSVLALNAASALLPQSTLQKVTPVLAIGSLISSLVPRQARYRGLQRTQYALAPAPQRLLFLRDRPARRQYRITDLRLPTGRELRRTLPRELRAGLVPPPPPRRLRLSPLSTQELQEQRQRAREVAARRQADALAQAAARTEREADRRRLEQEAARLRNAEQMRLRTQRETAERRKRELREAEQLRLRTQREAGERAAQERARAQAAEETARRRAAEEAATERRRLQEAEQTRLRLREAEQQRLREAEQQRLRATQERAAQERAAALERARARAAEEAARERAGAEAARQRAQEAARARAEAQERARAEAQERARRAIERDPQPDRGRDNAARLRATERQSERQERYQQFRERLERQGGRRPR